MTKKYILLLPIFLIVNCLPSYAQTETYYTINENEVQKKKFTAIQHELNFESKQKAGEEALLMGWGTIAGNLIPLLVDSASKLFYNPDNFNKEYFANHTFFNSSGSFKTLDPTSTMVFEHSGTNEKGKKEQIARFEFEMGAVKNVEGYHYIGLKAYDIAYSWSKLSSAKNGMNYVIDIGFYYFDDDDKAQEFHMNPLLLNSKTIGDSSAVIEDVNFQVIPKMKVLQIIQIRVREVNNKTQNWNKYLELYQNNQSNISKFLIKAIK